LVIYFGVIVLFLIVSISRPTYYVRYSIVSYGLLLFAFAYLLARYHKAYLKVVVVVLILGISIARAISIYEVNYDTSNTQVDDYLEANIQDGDIILFNNFMEFAITVKYQHVPTYFYNVLNWDVEKPYQALGKNVVITRNLDELKNYKGRIWIISRDYGYNKIMSYPGTKEVSSEKFNYKYYSDSKELNIILVEKK